MDYEALLKKYIDHVGWSEGTTFIGDHYKRTEQFTDEEWNELKRLDQELLDERTRSGDL